MKSSPAQFGTRENPASAGPHDSHVMHDGRLDSVSIEVRTPSVESTSRHSGGGTAQPPNPPDAIRQPSSLRPDDCPLSVRDAAKFLGVSPQTVYLWVERKQIPHLRVMGRNIRFLKSDLEPFRASFRQEMENG
jgi:excisionase family DNA binding protein